MNILKIGLPLLVLVFLFHNCSNNSNPVTSQKNENDLRLERLLVGKWKSLGDEVRHFNEDGTFVDTTISNRVTWGGYLTVCTELDSNDYFLNRIVNGNYEVINGILKMRPIEYLIDCNPLKAPASYIYFDSQIEFSGDTLKSRQFIQWKKKSEITNGIYGSWESKYWVWAYHDDLTNGAGPQLVTHSLIIFPDSTFFHERIVGLPYSGTLWRREFTYDPPNLFLVIGNEKFIVSFSENKMNWLDNTFTYLFFRLE
jgi:hypothetical protein